MKSKLESKNKLNSDKKLGKLWLNGLDDTNYEKIFKFMLCLVII